MHQNLRKENKKPTFSHTHKKEGKETCKGVRAVVVAQSVDAEEGKLFFLLAGGVIFVFYSASSSPLLCVYFLFHRGVIARKEDEEEDKWFACGLSVYLLLAQPLLFLVTLLKKKTKK